MKLDREKVTDRAVVPFILRQGSKNCPDFTDLNKKLCDLYGASLDAGVDKIGEYQMITLGIDRGGQPLCAVWRRHGTGM